MDTLEKIARSCLYEGYLLWPYRRSALKNAKRWTFGGVYPQVCSPSLGEPSTMRNQVLLEAEPDTEVEIQVRFLHLVDRQVLQEGPSGPSLVDTLTVDGRRYLSWEEAKERRVTLRRVMRATSTSTHTTSIAVARGTDREKISNAAGEHVCTLLRTWKSLTGTVRTESAQAAEGVFRLTVRIDNTTRCPRWAPGRHAREAAAAYAFLSTHTVLRATSGRFHSLADPPERLREAAAACENTGAWPALVSDERPPPHCHEGATTVLCSPVTLYDFPSVAPESPGDLFDGTEIDELLILSVLSLTEEEQVQARACDPRAAEILDRCAELGPERLGALHGAIREFQSPRGNV